MIYDKNIWYSGILRHAIKDLFIVSIIISSKWIVWAIILKNKRGLFQIITQFFKFIYCINIHISIFLKFKYLNSEGATILLWYFVSIKKKHNASMKFWKNACKRRNLTGKLKSLSSTTMLVSKYWRLYLHLAPFSFLHVNSALLLKTISSVEFWLAKDFNKSEVFRIIRFMKKACNKNYDKIVQEPLIVFCILCRYHIFYPLWRLFR